MSVYPQRLLQIPFVLFNGIVEPRVDIGRPMIHIMWPKSTSLSAVGGTFQANHFVPIVMRTSAGNLKKRKKENKDVNSNKKNNT